jgi:hypothetical protein
MLIKARQILINTAVLYLLIVFMGEARALILFSNNSSLIAAPDHYDIEIPHQHLISETYPDEEYVNTISIEFTCSYDKSFRFVSYSGIKSKDYPGLIWQPPKR